MRLTTLMVATMAVLGTPAVARAQTQEPKVKIVEETPGLMARAAVSGDSAIARAERAVPGGRITKAELEEEDGVLIYSFDLAVPGKPGIYEVHVNAITGKVGPVEHEASSEGQV